MLCLRLILHYFLEKVTYFLEKVKELQRCEIMGRIVQDIITPFTSMSQEMQSGCSRSNKSLVSGTPVPPPRAKSADPQRTPGEMYELESQLSDDESDVDPALKVYNEAMSQITTLSDVKEVEPLTFRLTSNWEEASKSEEILRKEKVDDACQAVCSVIAPNACNELLEAFKLSSSPGSDLTTLLTAYRNALNRGLKTKILSI